jgi:hypothetical protein
MANGSVISEAAPVVSDVHTQPTDAGGDDVGRILHVGTGLPRLIVVTVDTCDGAHAYAGLASSYYEQITEHWLRLDDAAWSTRIQGMAGDKPAEVEWTKSFVVEVH